VGRFLTRKAKHVSALLALCAMVWSLHVPTARAAAQSFSIYTASGTKIGSSAPSIATALKVFAQGAAGTDGLPVGGSKIMLQGIGFKAGSPIVAQFSNSPSASPQNSNDASAWADIDTYSPAGSSPCVPDAQGNFSGCYVYVPSRDISTENPYWLQMKDSNSNNWSVSTTGFGVVTPDLAIDPGSAIIANGQSQNFVASGGGVSATATYKWSTDAPAYGTLSSSGTYKENMTYHAGANPGTNTITLTDGDGNTVTATIEVTTLQATAISNVSGSATYGGSASLRATLKAGSTTLSGLTVTFTYDGNDYTATTNSSGVATATSVPLAAANADAGSYAGVVSASFSGDGTYAGSAGSGGLTVGKADASIGVTGYDVAFDGNPHTATGTATGIGSVDLSGLLDLSGTTHTDVGIYADSWSFDGDVNYNSASGTVTDSITAAGQSGFVLTVPGSITFGSTGTATTGGGQGTGAVTYEAGTSTGCTVNATSGVITVTDASGTCEITATKAGDGTYGPATDGPKSVTLNKANASISVTGYTVTYDGSAHTAAGTATGIGSADLSGLLDLSGTTHTDVGTYADSWSFDGDVNYNSASGTVSDSITAAGQSGFTLTVPVSITYGSTGTAGTAGGQGTGAVTYGAGTSTGCTVNATSGVITVTDASGTCEITATKAGDGTYGTATDGPKTVTLHKANASINVTGYDVAFDGSAHTATGTAIGVGGANLNALLDLSGTTHTDVGTYNNDPWTFAGNNNYNSASGTVNSSIAAAGQSGFTLTVPVSITYGSTGTATAGGGQGTGAVTYEAGTSTGCTVNATSGVITVTDASGTCEITATKAGDGTYGTATDGPKSVTLHKANASISVTGYDVAFDGSAHTATGTATGVGGANLNALLDLSGTTHTDVGTYADSWSFDGDVNYNSASGTVTDSITAAGQSGFTLTVPVSITYGSTGTATTGGGQGTGAVTYDAGTSTGCTVNATSGVITVTDASGTCEITATKAGDGTYGPATDGPKSVTLHKADASIGVTGYDVAFDGSAHTATGTATGIGSVDLRGLLHLGGTAHTDVGAYTDTWTFDGNNNYNAASGTVSDSITAAGQSGFTLTVPVSITFGSTGTATTGGGQGTGAVTYDAGTSTGCTVNATSGVITVTDAGGTCEITATKAGDGTYGTATDGPKSVTLHKADASISVTGYDVAFDGSAHTAAGMATGVGGADLSGLLDLSGTTHTDVGTYNNDPWSFAGNTNYNGAGGTVSSSIAGAGVLTGTVTTDAGYAVVGIRLYLTDAGGQSIADTTTGAGGAYRFDTLRGGTYTVKVKDADHPLTQATQTVPGVGGATLDLVIPATATMTLTADPARIVGNGKSTSQLAAQLRLLDNTTVDGTDVIFATTAGTFTAADARTGSDGKAYATLRAPAIEGLDEVMQEVSVRVHDVEHGIFAFAKIDVTFAPTSVDGIVLDNESPRNPIAGARVHLLPKHFDDGTVYEAEQVTGADGKYSIVVPRGNASYDLEIQIPAKVNGQNVVIDGEQQYVTTTQAAVVGDLSGERDAVPATKTIAGQVFASDKATQKFLDSGLVGTLQTPDGTVVKAVDVAGNGGFRVEEDPEHPLGGDYFVVLQVKAPDGQILAGVRIPVTVSANGELTIGNGLIDPFGHVTDAATGLPIVGATMDLRWANTPLNTSKGRVRGSRVDLPPVPNFPPNDNANTQMTSAQGEYAWMVFPEGDYYIIATKSDYRTFDSRSAGGGCPDHTGQDSWVCNGIIHVGTTVVNYDMQMSVASHAPQSGPLAPPVVPLQGATIQGAVVDTGVGQPADGAEVGIQQDLDGDGNLDVDVKTVTAADGSFQLPVPRRNQTYTLKITAPVRAGTKTESLTVTQTAVVPASSGAALTVSAQRTIAGRLLFVDISGGDAKPLTASQAQRLTASLETADGQPVNMPVTIDASGYYAAQDLAAGTYRILFRAKGADGRLLAVTTATVPLTLEGELGLQATVIDPFGTVRDGATGNPMKGVLVSLLWADTPLNQSAGRTPGTPANLPLLAGFAPQGNANPHYTDELGRYGWFCLPQGDYYVIAKKDGYLPYDSRNDVAPFLHVANGNCAVDFALDPMKLEVQQRYTRYIMGYPDGTFKPEHAVTRAEVAAILSRLMGTDLAAVRPAALKDVPAAHWAARYIAAVMAKGLMTGYPDGKFQPDAPITRAELATVLVRYKGLPTGRTGIFQDTVGHWAEQNIGAAFQAGMALGYTDNTFAPTATTKRAELVAMVNRMLGWSQLMTGRDTPRWPDVPFSYWAVRHIEKASISHTAKPGPDQMDNLVEVLPDTVQ
jgi:hypothetical protein